MMILQAAVDVADQAVAAHGFWHRLVNQLGHKYFLRLLFDLIAINILLFGIYLPNNHKNREYLFTFMMLNVVMFNIAYLLSAVEFSLGAGFGLFAVFGLLRYRTENIPMKDMTYLLLAIAMAIILAITKGNWEPAVVSAIILAITFIMDASFIFRKELSKSIQYENIEMIKPGNHAKLLEDLRQRTGLDIHYVSIRGVDYLRDTATIRIYYYEQGDGPVEP